jgi:Replication initiation factor
MVEFSQTSLIFANPYSVSCGVDAITATCSDIRAATRIYSTLGEFMHTLTIDGYRRTKFRVHEYEGHGVGPIRVGSSDRGTIVQCTGPYSEYVAGVLAEEEVRATRLDIQATFTFEQGNENWAAFLYDYQKELVSSGMSRRSNRYIESTTGSTVYTGSRKGKKTSRVYDKSLELQAAKGTVWRYETEYHGELAHAMFSTWITQEDREAWLKDAIQTAFQKLGMDCPCGSGNPASAMAISGKSKDRESYLRWLRHSVQPVVRDLQKHTEPGIILEALGIQLEFPF